MGRWAAQASILLSLGLRWLARRAWIRNEILTCDFSSSNSGLFS